MRKSILTTLVVILGNILYAFTVKLFLMPSGLITGGTTGIALALNHYFSIDINTFVLIFNILMLILGYLVLGKNFALTTIVSSFAYPFGLQLFDWLFQEVLLTDDLFLCTIFSGLGIGLALGIVIRLGASTGGMDIPPLVLNHYFKINVSVSMYGFDFAILLLQVAYNDINRILYGIILVIIYTVVLDKVLLIGTSRTEIKVISQQSEKIRQIILQDIDRGVTLIEAKGGFTKTDTTLLLSVISNRELPKVEKLIHDIDPAAFIIISRISEVKGRGFTMEKVYK